MNMEMKAAQTLPDSNNRGENENFMSEFLHFVQDGMYGSVEENDSILIDQTPVVLDNDPVAMTTVCSDLDLDLSDIEVKNDGNCVFQDIGLYLECNDDEVLHVGEQSTPFSSLTSLIGNNVHLQISFPVQNVDTVKTFICCNCTEAFPNKDSLKLHMDTMHKGIISCSKCTFQTKSEKVYRNHTTRLHPSNIQTQQVDIKDTLVQPVECFPEDFIAQDFTDNASKEVTHEENYQITINHGCSVTMHRPIGALSSNQGSIVSQSSNNVMSVCQDKNKEPSGKITSDKTENKYLTLSCEFCSYITCKEKLLSMHNKTMHSSDRKTFICHACQTVFKQKRSLVKHFAQKHKNAVNFQCEICSKVYASSEALHRHFKSHREERKYVCDHKGCDKKFKLHGTLTDHQKKVHGRGSCRSQISTINKMKDIREFPEIKSALPVLHPIHSERTKSAPNIDALDSVVMDTDTIKSGGVKSVTVSCIVEKTIVRKMFTCVEPCCGKTFRDKFNLKTHMKIHNKIKDIKCPLCSFCCAQNASLNHHLKTKHSCENL